MKHTSSNTVQTILHVISVFVSCKKGFNIIANEIIFQEFMYWKVFFTTYYGTFETIHILRKFDTQLKGWGKEEKKKNNENIKFIH